MTAIAAHPIDPETAYVTFSGYRNNEYLPHVFRTTNGGQDWEDISAGLPEVPVNDLIIDTENPEWLYLATDVGVYFSLDEGQEWLPLGTGLPNVPVTDLCLHASTHKLVAATYGRSMFSILLDEAVSAREAESNLSALNVFPNPAGSNTRLSFELTKEARVDARLFDQGGRQVKNIFQQQIAPGRHSHVINLTGLPSGYYVCQIRVEGQTIEKVVVISSVRD